jgi:Tfp pilus assembly protein PilN
MQTLHLDYQKVFRPFPTLGAIMLGGALVVAILSAWQYSYFVDVLTAWEVRGKEVKRLAEQHNVGRPAGPQDKEQLALETNRANEVLRRITLPWGELFKAVESAAPKHVALLALDPDADKQVMKIVAEAKDIAAMLDYMHTLEGRELFRTVTLQSHQVQQQDPQRPIRFSLVAAWQDQP